MSVGPFISELIRAANDVDRLATYERSNLLQRAARSIRDMREEVAASEVPAANGEPGDIVHDLLELSARVDEVAAEDVALALLDATADIKALRNLQQEKHKIERGEE